MLFLDFETRSECDLKTRGVYNYAQDPSTKVLCMAYAFDEEDVQIWTPDQPFPERVANHTGQIFAHNAAFERLIFWYVLCPDYNLPEPALEQFYCTAAQARANCAPGSLEDVGRFAGASMKKDHRGAQLVRKCCVPPFKHTAQDLLDLYDYCAQDVRAMRSISNALRQLSDEELADYHVSERINDRGILVDVPLARAAQQYAAQEVVDLQASIVEITNGAVPTIRSPRMREWVYANVDDDARAVMTDDEGKVTINKSTRAALLRLDTLRLDVREVIEAADDLWSSSVAKFMRMAALADDEDHRVRGAFVFAGGSATGRFASYGLQLHNLTRVSAKDPETLRHAIIRGHKLESGAARTLKTMLRPSIMAAPGRVLINYDWSAIEARVLPWLSGQGQEVLAAFERGEDQYVATARKMFNITEVSPDQRQQAKVAVLACGFAGGAGALQNMAKAYGLPMPDAEAKRLVNLWRSANIWAVHFWQQLDRAAMNAVRHPETPINAGRASYLSYGGHLWYSLPSGRVLCYPNAKFDDEGNITYSKAAWKPAADATEWPRAKLWPGLMAENLTQATAADVLRHALRRLDAEGLEVIMTVHDEIVVECDAADAERVSARVHQIMCEAPDWAQDLPLAAEGGIYQRYC